ncbi:hypothetical protein FRC06_002696 [Ceratobasidium sp. 370]|nr:hypothetical protein FRC06_002696 [Ceratobasidium sp. 370]
MQEEGQNGNWGTGEANLGLVGKMLGDHDSSLFYKPGKPSPFNASEPVDRPPSASLPNPYVGAAILRFDPTEHDTAVVSSHRTEPSPNPLVKCEDDASWPDNHHDDVLHGAPPYHTSTDSAHEYARVSLDKLVEISLPDPQIDHSMSYTPTSLRPKDHDRSVECSDPTDEKPTLPIKKEDVDRASELNHPGSSPVTNKMHEALVSCLCSPDSCTAHARSRTRSPGFSQGPSLLSDLIEEPGQPARLNYRSLATLLLNYFIGLGLSRSLSLPLSRHITTRFTAKIKTCSNIPNGDPNSPGFQSGAGMNSTFGGLDWHFGLENGSEMWPGRGPGRQQLSLEQSQTELSEQLLLLSLAEKYGQDLVPRYRNPVRTPPTQSVNLPPVPPVPPRSNLPPRPSCSESFTEADPNLDFDPGWLPPLDQPARPIHNDYGLYDGAQTSTSSNYLPNTPCPSWRGEHKSSSAPPLPNLLTEGPGYNAHNASWPNALQSIPESQDGFQFILTPPGVPSDATPPGPGHVLGNMLAGANTNIDQQFAALVVPGHGRLVPLPITGNDWSHTSMGLQVTEQSSGTTSQIGPKRTARKVPCLVEGCGRTFPRPHLREDHMNLVHRGNRGK